MSSASLAVPKSRPAALVTLLGLVASLAVVSSAEAIPTLRTLSISDATVTEGAGVAASAVFTVTLSSRGNKPLTFDYASSDGTAKAGSDYTATSGTMNIGHKSDTAQITVPVNPDALDEYDETFSVNLSNASDAIIIDPEGIGTILDDDLEPVVTIDPISVLEGDVGSAAGVFTARLSEVSGREISFRYETLDGSATSGLDYQSSEGSVRFEAGQRIREIPVSVLGDLLDEPNEEFTVRFTNGVNVAFAMTNLATATVLDDDPAPSLAVSDATVLEGDVGASQAALEVRLSRPSGWTVTVDFATSDGSALSGADYASATGTVTFSPGETERKVLVQVTSETLFEDDESFTVTLSNPVNAELADSSATALIVNDDSPPTLTVDDVTAPEASGVAVFTFRLSQASGKSAVFRYETRDGTAKAGFDYGAVSSYDAIETGETEKQVWIPLGPDAIDEFDETFLILVSDVFNAIPERDHATATILDDDAPPSISIADVTIAEGDAGATPAQLKVTLSSASGKPITVNYATQDGSAKAGIDYRASTGTVSFGEGQTEASISVEALGNTLDESDRSFTVLLSNSSNATLADSEATATITDDDPLPQIQILDASGLEGDSSGNLIAFDLTLSAPSGRAVAISYSTSDGTAVGGSDYVATSGTVSFSPGEQLKKVEISTIGDLENEHPETFSVHLSTPVDVEISRGSATGTILNDDSVPSLSIGDVSVAEGDSGSIPAAFTVSLSRASGLPVTVNYATQDGSATSGSDYVAASGTLTFLPGEAQKAVAASVLGDALNEADETFFVNLSAPTNATIVKAQGRATIVNNDPLPSITITDVSATEGNSGTADAVFTVTLSAASGREMGVNFATSNGTATAPGDYTPTSGSLTFLPGETIKTITVKVNGDTVGEFDETFFVNLSGAANAVFARSRGTGTIVNDDSALTINNVSVVEGSHLPFLSGGSLFSVPSVVVEAVFTVTLSPAANQRVTVAFATRDGTATDGTKPTTSQTLSLDYVRVGDVLAFEPGETTKQIKVQIDSDQWEESNENFFVDLSLASNATILAGTGTATIVNDDLPVFVGLLEPHPPSGCTRPVSSIQVSCSFAHGGAQLGASPHHWVIIGISTGVRDGFGNIVIISRVTVALFPPNLPGFTFLFCSGVRACANSGPWISQRGTWKCVGFTDTFVGEGTIGCFVQ